jgi:hypothetical protein
VSEGPIRTAAEALEAAARLADKWHAQNKSASAAYSRKANRLGNDPFGHGEMARQSAADLAFVADECAAFAIAIRALSARIPAPAGDEALASVLHFRPGSEAPDTPAGSEATFIVTVRRAHNKDRVFTFAATYLNAYPLEWNEGDGCGDCPEDGSHDDGCPMTGWFTDRFHPDYNSYYEHLLAPGDDLLEWAAFPDRAALAVERAARDHKQGVIDRLLVCARHDAARLNAEQEMAVNADARAEAAEGESARLREALTRVRACFRVERLGGGNASISYDSDGLQTVIATLDAALQEPTP